MVEGKAAYVEQCVSLSNVPWRHASQLYEVVLGLIVIAILLFIDKKYGERRPVGLMGSAFLLVYFCGRFTVEMFKEFQSLQAQESILTMGQYLSLPFMLIGALGVYYSIKKWTPTNEQTDIPEWAKGDSTVAQGLLSTMGSKSSGATRCLF